MLYPSVTAGLFSAGGEGMAGFLRSRIRISVMHGDFVVRIEQADLISFCGDTDGCELRIIWQHQGQGDFNPAPLVFTGWSLYYSATEVSGGNPYSAAFNLSPGTRSIDGDGPFNTTSVLIFVSSCLLTDGDGITSDSPSTQSDTEPGLTFGSFTIGIQLINCTLGLLD